MFTQVVYIRFAEENFSIPQILYKLVIEISINAHMKDIFVESIENNPSIDGIRKSAIVSIYRSLMEASDDDNYVRDLYRDKSSTKADSGSDKNENNKMSSSGDEFSVKVNSDKSSSGIISAPNRKISYIVLHYTVSQSSGSGSALATAGFFAKGSPDDKTGELHHTAADFITDDSEIYQYNPDPDNMEAMAVGSDKQTMANPKASGFASMYGKITNGNSISVEMSSSKTKKEKSPQPEELDWYFTDEVKETTKKLVRWLMDKYSIDEKHIYMHYNVTNKLCPAMWCHDDDGVKEFHSFVSECAGSKLLKMNISSVSLPEEMKNAPDAEFSGFGQELYVGTRWLHLGTIGKSSGLSQEADAALSSVIAGASEEVKSTADVLYGVIEGKLKNTGVSATVIAEFVKYVLSLKGGVNNVIKQ